MLSGILSNYNLTIDLWRGRLIANFNFTFTDVGMVFVIEPMSLLRNHTRAVIEIT